MYIHLGTDVLVRSQDIIAILDLESTTTISHITNDFLKVVEEEGFIRNVSDNIPKSFVICEVKRQSVVYITNVSAKTLYKRMEKNYGRKLTK